MVLVLDVDKIVLIVMIQNVLDVLMDILMMMEFVKLVEVIV
jgi:hypothetical protein